MAASERHFLYPKEEAMKTFKVSNYKGIKGTVEVSVNGGSVVVQGRNAAGKSSFIDGITELFDARGIRLTPHPINEGAEDARAEYIDEALDVRIVREWKRDKDGKPKSTLAVYALDGAKHASPSQVIADLTGGMIFDPSRFLLLDPKPQRDMLLQKVVLPFDLEALEGRERAAEEARLQKGQVARAAEGAVTNAHRPEPGTPDKPVSTAELVAKLNEARQNNTDLQRASDLHVELLKQAAGFDDRVAALRRQIEELEAEQVTIYARADEAKAAAASLKLIDTTELEAQVENVDHVNREVQVGEIFRALEEEAEVKRKEWEQAEALVKQIQHEKAEGLKVAEFPHPSLSVSDEGVLYDGVPFSQLNVGQREEAAFAIATAGNPDLKLVIVKNGDMMDESTLARIDKIATERDYTVLVERGRPDVGGLVATFVEMVDGQAA